jgi:hypothetical protein
MFLASQEGLCFMELVSWRGVSIKPRPHLSRLFPVLFTGEVYKSRARYHMSDKFLCIGASHLWVLAVELVMSPFCRPKRWGSSYMFGSFVYFWILPSSGLLLSLGWFRIDVSGLTIGSIFKSRNRPAVVVSIKTTLSAVVDVYCTFTFTLGYSFSVLNFLLPACIPNFTDVARTTQMVEQVGLKVRPCLLLVRKLHGLVHRNPLLDHIMSRHAHPTCVCRFYSRTRL